MFSVILNLPVNVFGNSNSNDNGDKIDTSLFLQKPFSRTNCIESNIEEDIDLQIDLEINVYQILLAYEKQLRKIVLIIFSTILV